MKSKIQTRKKVKKMGNPFTMMDKYHQSYWQNYNYSSRASDHVRSEMAHDITKEQAKAEGFRDPYITPVSEKEKE